MWGAVLSAHIIVFPHLPKIFAQEAHTHTHVGVQPLTQQPLQQYASPLI